MSEKYNPRIIENKWQDFWKNNKTFKSAVNKNKEKYYILEMFPYPSENTYGSCQKLYLG